MDDKGESPERYSGRDVQVMAEEILSNSPTRFWRPSVEVLLPSRVQNLVPWPMVVELITRYEEKGHQYLTDKRDADDRICNSCMNEDTLELAEEELIDALFNVLVHSAKLTFYVELRDAVVAIVEAWQAVRDAASA